MKNTTGKRVLSLLMIAAVLFLSFPAAVWADGADQSLPLYCDGAQVSALTLPPDGEISVTAGQEALAWYQWQIYSWTKDEYVDLMGQTGATLRVTAALAGRAMNSDGECRIRCTAGRTAEETLTSGALAVTVASEPPVSIKPTEPEEPTVSGEPTEPEEPTVSSEPTEPEEPTVSSEPTVPEEPTVSSEPTEPEEPTVSSEPTVPEKPADPEEPDPVPGNDTGAALTAQAAPVVPGETMLRAQAQAPLRRAAGDEYNVTVKFLYADESPATDGTAAPKTNDVVAGGAAYSAIVDIVTKPGFASYWTDSAAAWNGSAWDTGAMTAGTSFTVSSAAMDADRVYYVVYAPQTAAYSVKRMIQNVTRTGYDYYDTIPNAATAQIGSSVTTVDSAAAGTVAGFTQADYTAATPGAGVTVAANGSAEVQVCFNRNAHTVTLDLNGGIGLATTPMTVYYGVPQTIGQPRKTNSRFTGWEVTAPAGLSDAEKAAVKAEADAGALTGRDFDVSLKATWDNPVVPYTVEYWLDNPDDDGETVVSSVPYTAEAGSTVNPLTVVTLTNRVPQYPDSNLRNYVDYDDTRAPSSQVISIEGTTVFRVYFKRRTYTFSFDLWTNYNSEEGNPSTSPSVTINGTTYTYTSSSSTPYAFTTKYGADISDKWPSVDDYNHPTKIIKKRTKTYNFQYVQILSGSTKTFDAAVPLATGELIPNGNTRSYTCTVTWFSNTVKRKYTAYYQLQDLDGNTALSTYTTVDTKQTADRSYLPAYAYEGFTCTNPTWNSGNSRNYTYNRNQYGLQTLAPDGSEIHLEDYYYGATLTQPADPTLTGYTHAGWYLDAELTQEITDWSALGSMPAHALTVYSKWEPVRYYTVKVYTTDDFTVAPLDTVGSVESGRTVTTSASPSYPNHRFVRWVTGSGDTVSEFVFGTTPVTANLNVYAEWQGTEFSYYTVKQVNRGTGEVLHTELSATAPRYGQSITVAAPDAPEGFTRVSPASLTKVITQNAEEFVFEYDPVSNPVGIKYIAVVDGRTSPLLGNSITYDWYYGLPDNAPSVTATAADEYGFRGWFTDRACTQAASAAMVSGNTLHVSGLTGDAVFYAKFVNTVPTIRITNSSGANGIFDVKRDGATLVTVAVPAGGSALVRVGEGECTVQSGQIWNRPFGQHSDAQTVTPGDADDPPEVTFTAVAGAPVKNWLCAEARPSA